MYQKVPVTLTHAQVRKMMNGHPIQLSHRQLVDGKHWLALHHETAKRVGGAIRRKRGVRIHISPHELEASGEGIRDFFDKVISGAKKVGSFLKEKVIDTPFYQQNIRPLARNAVNTAFQAAAPSLGVAAPIAQKGIDVIGEKTGAFGLRRRRGRPRGKRGGELTHQSPEDIVEHEFIRETAFAPVIYHPAHDMSQLIASNHPANWPPYVNLAPIGGKVKRHAPTKKKRTTRRRRGGSFLPA